MPRDACLTDPLLLVLLVASNLVICAAYTAIPATMAWIALRSERVPFPAIGALFGGFILSCGGTHLCAALVFFRPAWHLEAVACCFTAMISTTTAILLWNWRKQVVATLRDFAAFAATIKQAKQAAAQ